MHGTHIDISKTPAAAWVSLEIFYLTILNSKSQLLWIFFSFFFHFSHHLLKFQEAQKWPKFICAQIIYNLQLILFNNT